MSSQDLQAIVTRCEKGELTPQDVAAALEEIHARLVAIERTISEVTETVRARG